MSNNLALLVSPLNPTVIDTGSIDSYLGIFDLAGSLTITGAGTDVTTALLVNALGSIAVENGATLDIAGIGLSVAGNTNIGPGGTLIEGGLTESLLSPTNFIGSGGKLEIQNLSGYSQTLSPITGFAVGDTIEVNTPITAATYNASTDTLTLTDGSTTVGSLSLTGIGLSAGFTVTHDPNGGYDIAVACFLPQTRVLTDRGEVAIGEMAIGDRVITRSGEAKPVKWIGRRSYSASVVASAPHVAPVTIRAGALGEGLPTRDLHLSPCHAMYLDEVLIEAGHLVNGVSIVRPDVSETVEYVNLEFDSHEVIFVEGAPAETGAGAGNRIVYDNAAEYAALYPHEAQAGIKPYCAPRLDCGFVVEAVRRRIDSLAGIEAGSVRPGALKGWIENVDAGWVRGVAYDSDSTAPVVLELVVDGDVVGEVIANHDRKLLVEGQHIEGRFGFHVKVPEGLSAFRRHVVSVRRKADGAELFGAPYLLEAAVPMTAVGQHKLGQAIEKAAAGAGSVAELDRAISFLAAKADALLQAKADLAGHRAERGTVRPLPGRSELRAVQSNEPARHAA